MYDNKLEFEYKGNTLETRIIIPDKIEGFLEEKVFALKPKEKLSGLMEKIRDGIILALRFEGKCEWLSKSTLNPEKNASFYAYEIGYSQPNNGYSPSNNGGDAEHCELPSEFEIVGWFFDYIDVSLETLSLPGQGNIRFACNKLFKRMVDQSSWYKDEIKQSLLEDNISPTIKEILTKIYNTFFYQIENS